jgi:group I intron endonuclease
MKKEIICGVYIIKCKVNNMIYIGGSINIHKRWIRHRNSLNKNEKGCNKYLQEDWNKYKEENFEINILEECNKDNLLKKEMYYTKLYKSNKKEFGYNISCGNSGRVYSEDTKLKISIGNKGKKFSEESKLKMSISKIGNTNKLGKKTSEEAKLKMSIANKGNKYALGYKHSEEAKIKISNAKKENK